MYIQRKLLLATAVLSIVLPAERLVLKVPMPAFPAFASALADDNGRQDGSDHNAGGDRGGGDDHGDSDDHGGAGDRSQRTELGDDDGGPVTRDRRLELGYDKRTATAPTPTRSPEERHSIFDWFGHRSD